MLRSSGFTLLGTVLSVGGYLFFESRPPLDTPVATLDLAADRVEERLVLRWDPSARVLARAGEARLTVRDGRRVAHFALDRADLDAGRLEYEPRSSRVEFTFEAHGAQPLVATLTVIDPSL